MMDVVRQRQFFKWTAKAADEVEAQAPHSLSALMQAHQ